MDFSAHLNRYIEEIGCTAKDLADASSISAAAISRYRAGDRTPDPDSKQLRMLAAGLATLSDGALDEQVVHDDLASTISGIAVDYDTFLENLKMLLSALSANNNELARALSFDPSYISRILSGQRRPADMHAFTTGIAKFAAHRCVQGEASQVVRELLGDSWPRSDNEDDLAQALATWLGTNHSPLTSPIGSFLEKFDAFDLDDFIRAVHFDEMKVPTSPIQLPTTKTYEGIREMKDCEIDFLKFAVLSKSTASVIMYSNMPIEEMAADEEFSKKWMYGMAMLLKKGLHLHMVHETNRPLPEMMLGLESWIPMYMTGQISPYYFEGAPDGVFSHILWSAGTVALQGEAIVGHQGEGRFVLTKNRDEVLYYRKRAERMLEKARPLMRIITAANADKLSAFHEEDAKTPGARRVIMSTLPIGSIPGDLLERMLERNEVERAERDAIRAFAQQENERFRTLVSTYDMRFEVSSMTHDEFAEHPPALDLSAMFHKGDIVYTPEEYAEHFEALQSIVEAHPSCTLAVDANQPFRNVQISICEGHHVLVSKIKGPIIHFVIEHPAMVTAFERFSAPISE